MTGYEEAEKMKFNRGILMLLAIVSCGLGGCLSNPAIYQQIASGYSGCDSKDIQISDVTAELNSTETWIAECDGKRYICSYHSSGGADCSELDR
jgi:hypothetical protein